MPMYRTYIIGRADHFWGAEDIDCADDQEVIQKVQQTMDGRDVEVWERGRFIVRLSSDLIPKYAASFGGFQAPDPATEVSRIAQTIFWLSIASEVGFLRGEGTFADGHKAVLKQKGGV